MRFCVGETSALVVFKVYRPRLAAFSPPSPGFSPATRNAVIATLPVED
jgi:hypothetical protein